LVQAPIKVIVPDYAGPVTKSGFAKEQAQRSGGGEGLGKRTEAGELLNLAVKAYNRAVKVNVKL
jgi:hypothetical protein